MGLEERLLYPFQKLQMEPLKTQFYNPNSSYQLRVFNVNKMIRGPIVISTCNRNIRRKKGSQNKKKQKGLSFVCKHQHELPVCVMMYHSRPPRRLICTWHLCIWSAFIMPLPDETLAIGDKGIYRPGGHEEGRMRSMHIPHFHPSSPHSKRQGQFSF